VSVVVLVGVRTTVVVGAREMVVVGVSEVTDFVLFPVPPISPSQTILHDSTLKFLGTWSQK
jgi:hypothetical protein